MRTTAPIGVHCWWLVGTRKLRGSPFVIIAIALTKDFPALVWDSE
jgi:hypothetical protein